MWADQRDGMKAYYDKKNREYQKNISKPQRQIEKSIQDPDDTFDKWQDSEFDNSSYRHI
jgi:hypothetical protein